MEKTDAVEFRNVRKVFGSVAALEDLTLAVPQGNIHGLLGENGAGKSTLMNILYGLYAPDHGEVYLEGSRATIRSPYDSIRHGIGMVHQASTLVGEFDAVENIIIGTEGATWSLPIAKERVRIQEICDRFGLQFPLDVRTKELSAGIKQKIEIVRALYREARLLILDEPTTSLVESEFRQLLESLRTLVSEGVTVIFITHKIKEVMEACASVAVLRKGRLQGVLTPEEMSKENLVKLMFHEKDIQVTESALPQVDVPPSRRAERPVLTMDRVRTAGSEGKRDLKDVTLALYPGEILGVAAVSGNGEKDLAQVLLDPRSMASGEILLDGQSIRHLTPTEVLGKGLAYTPEDRIQEGILPDGSITDNILLGHQSEPQFLSGGSFVRWKAVRKATRKVIDDYEVLTPSQELPIRCLSGGNIQKVIVGRAYVSPVKVLVTHNPTSGLDISTVKFIFGKLVETRNQGGAVLWINEDLDELMIVCDRIAVLYEGRLQGVFTREQFDKYRIGIMMIGGSE